MTETTTTQGSTAIIQAEFRQKNETKLVRLMAAVIEGPDLGLAFPLLEGPLNIGKGNDCDVVLTDRAVSNLHLELRMEGGSVRVRDLGSTNGTFVGNTRIVESVLPGGSVVKLGRTRLHLRGNESNRVLIPSTNDHFGELCGQSVTMRQVFSLLERAASRDVNILLDGESGTGKESAARSVHLRSSRKSGPFVVLDCSSVSPDLIESQLFGHRRGAFTGAMQDRAGVFEEASGGTLFLDELDRLPLDLQKRLLRLLDDGRVTRLGEETQREVDIRLIAACGRSPENIVGTGEFRRDLYDKLAVVRVSLPALRDRLDDLPVLVERLLSEVGGEHISVTAGTNLSLLQKHPWQGNIRELRTVLERALLLAEGTVSDFDALPLRLSHVLRRKEEQLSSDRTNKVHLRLPYKEARERALRSFEKTYLEAALSRNGANLSRTARDIGLTRHYLRKLLREHRLISARPPGRPPGRRNPPKNDPESS